jgi:hypothetical protein
MAGTETIPEQIVSNRSPYYDALEAADNAYDEDRELTPRTVIDMEELMKAMLAKQLKSAFDQAIGNGG